MFKRSNANEFSFQPYNLHMSLLRCFGILSILYIRYRFSLYIGNNTEFYQRNALRCRCGQSRIKRMLRYIPLFRLSFVSSLFCSRLFRRACVFSTEPSRIVCAFSCFSERFLFFLCCSSICVIRTLCHNNFFFHFNFVHRISISIGN